MSISVEEKNSVLDLLQYCNEKVVVFDVGSNKGAWADIIINERDSSTLAGKYSIHLFEPNELLLNYTRVKYDYHKNIHYCPDAAYSKGSLGIDFYYFTNENSGLSSLYYNERWKDLPMQIKKVFTTTLDHYLLKSEETEVDIIKVDTEGSEYDVLLGCDYILTNKKAKFIQVEYSPHYQLTNRKFTDVIEYMSKFGYDCHSWDGQYFNKVKKEEFVEDYRLDNFVFTYLPITKCNYAQPDWNQEFIKNTRSFGKSIHFALEIGCFDGLTTNYICDKLLTPTGRIICIDPLEDEYLVENKDEFANKINRELHYFKNQYDRFIKNTKGKPVELIRKTSNDAFEWLKQTNDHYRFNFIYIDGDHRAEQVYLDGKNYFKFLQIDGYMLFDDYSWGNGETKKGIDKFLLEHKWCSKLIIQGEQVMIKKTEDAY